MAISQWPLVRSPTGTALITSILNVQRGGRLRKNLGCRASINYDARLTLNLFIVKQIFYCRRIIISRSLYLAHIEA